MSMYQLPFELIRVIQKPLNSKKRAKYIFIKEHKLDYQSVQHQNRL
jgi:hypothetical protein